MKIVLGIPSLDRDELLAKAIVSAKEAGFKDIYVMRERFPRPRPAIISDLNRYVFNELEADVCVTGSDRCRYHKGFVDALEEVFTEPYMLAGTNILNCPFHKDVTEFCFVAYDKVFAEHFPQMHTECPDYWHFYADTELGLFAKEIGRYKYCEGAKISMEHPNTGAPKDATWKASRIFAFEDKQVRKGRERAGLLWGRTFDRLESVSFSQRRLENLEKNYERP